MKRIRTSALGLALVAVLAACSDSRSATAGSTTPATSDLEGTEPAPSGAASLMITTFSFSPASLDVPAGAAVTVSNGDPTTHTVTAGTPGEPTGAFDVRLAGKGSTADLGVLVPGTYPYFCRIHTAMTGRLVVG